MLGPSLRMKKKESTPLGRLPSFLKLTFQIILSGTLRLSNSLETDHDLCLVNPDLNPNC